MCVCVCERALLLYFPFTSKQERSTGIKKKKNSKLGKRIMNRSLALIESLCRLYQHNRYYKKKNSSMRFLNFCVCEIITVTREVTQKTKQKRKQKVRSYGLSNVVLNRCIKRHVEVVYTVVRVSLMKLPLFSFLGGPSN